MWNVRGGLEGRPLPLQAGFFERDDLADHGPRYPLHDLPRDFLSELVVSAAWQPEPAGDAAMPEATAHRRLLAAQAEDEGRVPSRVRGHVPRCVPAPCTRRASKAVPRGSSLFRGGVGGLL